MRAARKLRRLQPHGKPLASDDVGNNDTTHARYLHCLFSYETDLKYERWLNTEFDRVNGACGGEHLIDTVYVVDRGIIQFRRREGRIKRIGRIEDENGGAIINFYFSILNFLQREGGRRKPTPYERYTRSEPKSWTQLSGAGNIDGS